MVGSGANPRGTVTAPSGPIRLGELTQGKPWAKLSWPFGPQTATLHRYRLKPWAESYNTCQGKKTSQIHLNLAPFSRRQRAERAGER
jgi:hypothetical protein